MRVRQRPLVRYHSKALRDTREALGMSGKMFALALAAAFFFFWLWAFDQPLKNEAVVWGCGVLGLVCGFGILYIWFLIFSPAKLLVESDREIDMLRDLVNRRDEVQEILAELADLRKTGIELRNERIDDNRFPAWHQEFETWNQQAIATTSRLSPAEGKLIEILGEMGSGLPQGVTVVPGNNGNEHARCLLILTTKTNRIKEVVVRYSDVVTRLSMVDMERVKNFLQGWRPIT